MTNTILKNARRLIPKTISSEQARDTGMAMFLICLLIAFFGHQQKFYSMAILLLVVNMIRPNVFKPLAKLWLGFSQILGSVMSKLILAIIFFVLVMPVGFIRKAMMGKDRLRIKKWKNGHDSVFKTREHEFTSADIKNPY